MRCLSIPRAERVVLAAVLLLAACPGPDRPPGGPPSDTVGTVDSVQARQEALKNGEIPVRDASLTVLDSTGNVRRALLQVAFGPGLARGSTVRITPDDKEVELRDDGRNGDSTASDGIFSAIIDTDVRELAAEARRVAPLVRAGRAVPRFDGRIQVGRERLSPAVTAALERIRPGFRIPVFPLGIPDPLLKERSLMIVAPPVVTDPTRTFDPCTNVGNPTGVWTFGHLMTEMANQGATGVAPGDFARQWLAQWETPQTVNGFTIPARTGITGIGGMIITPWQQASGGGALDLTKAPFRLLAIVNRVDLRQNLVYGGGSAGEARFVFGAVGPKPTCRPLPFTVIFEYGVQQKSCGGVRAWAKQWHDLRALDPNDPAYRTALQAITDQFVKAGANPSQQPNQNALNQLRTNERAIGVPWELREFRLSSTGSPAGHLASVTVKQEPDMGFNQTQTVADYVNQNATAIVQDRHTVPEPFNGQPFLGARAPIPGDNTGFFWGNGSAMTTANSRFHFSFNTCSGCHTGETGTRFVHIDPETGPPAALSGFLTGISVPDPDQSDADNSTRTFADLDRRALDLDALVNSLCIRQIAFKPIRFMTH